MAAKKKKDVKYVVTLMGARGIIKILMTVLIIIFFIFLARTSYTFGYAIFNETAMDTESPKEVLVEIPRGASTLDIAGILEDNDLIENKYIFMVQERFSTYHGDLEAGKYYLNTGQTPSQMLKILARVDTENQPEQDDESTETDSSGTSQ